MSLKSLVTKVAAKLIKPAAVAASTSTTPKITFITKAVSTIVPKITATAGVITAVGTAAVLAPAPTLAVAKVIAPTALTAAVIAAFAPETAKVIVNSPEATKTAIAFAVNPAAGYVVGIEQGGGLISTAFKTQTPLVQGAIVAATGVIAGTVATLGVSSLLNPTEGATPLGNIINKITGKGNDVVTDITPTPTPIPTPQTPVTPSGTPEVISNAGVIPAQTVDVTSKKRAKHRKVKQLQYQHINQSVKIMLNQNIANKKYLRVIAQ
jgi:hypothetical protein